jgi:toxin co-regulated pilus biosynthesis protein Q
MTNRISEALAALVFRSGRGFSMAHDSGWSSRRVVMSSVIALLSIFCIAAAHSQISEDTRRAARNSLGREVTETRARGTPQPISPRATEGVTRVDNPFTNLEVAPASILLPLAPPQQPKGYVLRTGEPIHTELKGWAERYGWEFYWYHASSWTTLRETSIDKVSVEDAVGVVIDILRSEGKPVQLRISDGNHVMEVLSTEVRND